MSERSKYLTVIVGDPTKEEASALIGHPKMPPTSWSHAIEDRDAKDAEIAELRARIVECEEAVGQAVALAEYLEGHSKGAMAERVKTALSAKFAQERRSELANLMRRSMLLVVTERERDEALECVRRLCRALEEIAAFKDVEASARLVNTGSYSRFDEPHAVRSAREALAATPEHLR